ncbi:hypothetical protein SETIT_5G339600v2 [Setaria italica]|uniref:Uncharacterized protein n=1 Tax=Setaria italica TaxID=4555 RepID=A0A368RBS1_SETIT|nr:hypothetical protein SETIT_5G339600v2 [Setaria italica]
MCHPGLPPLPPGCAVRRRPGVSPSPSAAARPGPTRVHQAQPRHYCVCSPTAHRGSFRCRWHRVGYEWGRRRPFARDGAGAEQAMHE